jgi:hypothetical protein
MTDQFPHADMQKRLLQAISLEMPKYGFNKKFIGQSFYRSLDYGKWALHLSFIKHSDDCDVTADVSIRIDRIEELANKFDDRMKPSDKSKTFTIGAEFGNMIRIRPKRWTMMQESDIPLISSEILDKFNSIGIPYFQKYSNLENMYILLSSNRDLDHIHCPLIGPRCLRTVSLAYILLKYDQIQNLIDKCDKILESNEDLQLNQYRKLVSYIKDKINTYG